MQTTTSSCIAQAYGQLLEGQGCSLLQVLKATECKHCFSVLSLHIA